MAGPTLASACRQAAANLHRVHDAIASLVPGPYDSILFDLTKACILGITLDIQSWSRIYPCCEEGILMTLGYE